MTRYRQDSHNHGDEDHKAKLSVQACESVPCPVLGNRKTQEMSRTHRDRTGDNPPPPAFLASAASLVARGMLLHFSTRLSKKTCWLFFMVTRRVTHWSQSRQRASIAVGSEMR